MKAKMILRVKLEDKDYCKGCPCLVKGACNWICSYYDEILEAVDMFDSFTVKRQEHCKKENK